MKFGVVVFPGSNCDRDCFHVLHRVLGQPTEYLWHQERDLRGVDAVIVPGGFSYGDYLRAGAIARFSPVMEEVVSFAERGGPVLGICNGFQILLEIGLLPGAMLRNRSLRFICRDVHLRFETQETPFTRAVALDETHRIPIAHAEGNYYADDETLARMEGEGQVVCRYVRADGAPDEAANPNGSRHRIAGICNADRNVVGMMPHPERASESALGGVDGRAIFESVIAT